jgi:hypothetical protein
VSQHQVCWYLVRSIHTERSGRFALLNGRILVKNFAPKWRTTWWKQVPQARVIINIYRMLARRLFWRRL